MHQLSFVGYSLLLMFNYRYVTLNVPYTLL